MSRQECWDYHHIGDMRASYRLLGYFFILDTTSGRPPILGPGNKKWLRTPNIKNAADAELVTDATLSDKVTFHPPEYPYGNFAQVLAGGAEAQYIKYPDTSSHLKSEKEPTGANIGFADCHVDWRNFKEGDTLIMKERYGITSPVFWW